MVTTRWDVQGLVTLASEIACELCRVPTIPVSDWGERAASSLRLMSDRSPVLVGLGRYDSEGGLAALEVSGIGWPGARERFSSSRLLDPDRGGWSQSGEFGQACDSERVLVSSMAERAREDWRSLGVVELVHCSMALWASRPRRRAVVIAGMTQEERGEASARALLLASLLPILADRAASAFGLEKPIDAGLRLTPREEEVLELLMVGRSIKQIAAVIGRSPHTVHDHVKSLHTKLGAKSRGELVARGLGHIGVERCGEVPLGRPEMRVTPATASMRLPAVVERTSVSVERERSQR